MTSIKIDDFLLLNTCYLLHHDDDNYHINYYYYYYHNCNHCFNCNFINLIHNYYYHSTTRNNDVQANDANDDVDKIILINETINKNLNYDAITNTTKTVNENLNYDAIIDCKTVNENPNSNVIIINDGDIVATTFDCTNHNHQLIISYYHYYSHQHQLSYCCYFFYVLKIFIHAPIIIYSKISITAAFLFVNTISMTTTNFFSFKFSFSFFPTNNFDLLFYFRNKVQFLCIVESNVTLRLKFHWALCLNLREDQICALKVIPIDKNINDLLYFHALKRNNFQNQKNIFNLNLIKK